MAAFLFLPQTPSSSHNLLNCTFFIYIDHFLDFFRTFSAVSGSSGQLGKVRNCSVNFFLKCRYLWVATCLPTFPSPRFWGRISPLFNVSRQKVHPFRLQEISILGRKSKSYNCASWLCKGVVYESAPSCKKPSPISRLYTDMQYNILMHPKPRFPASPLINFWCLSGSFLNYYCKRESSPENRRVFVSEICYCKINID